jgi:uncharacterized iron-regulated membrane protein
MLYASKQLIKQMLHAHKWMGVSLGAVLYLICLSGTVLVFGHEFERWQQPHIDEFDTLSPRAIDNARQQILQRSDTSPETIWVMPPTDGMPRAHVTTAEHEWFTDSEGNLTEVPLEEAGFAAMLRHLHYYLHLPENFGMIIVGIFGVMLLGLALSGVLAHPAIIKDAFKLRLEQSYRLQQTDIHNRLSVWSLPFSLMIALTGAYIGLISVMVVVAAPLLYNNDRTAIMDAVYGADPIMDGEISPFDTRRALDELRRIAPEAEPIYLAYQHPGSRKQFLEIAATLPGRLTYSEIYRFNSAGDYVNHQGLSDGPVARVVAYSVYRLHFGQFGGFGVKLLYVVFGLALTVVCAGGINIWLAKRKRETRINSAWAALVWGTPLGLSGSALLSVFVPTLATGTFWGITALVLVAGIVTNCATKVRASLQWLLSASLVTLALAHLWYTEAHTTAGIGLAVDLILLLVGLAGVWLLSRQAVIDSPEPNLLPGD